MCQLGALEAIRSGTTAVLEDSTDIADYAEAMQATGLRLTLTERAADRKGASIVLKRCVLSASKLLSVEDSGDIVECSIPVIFD